MTINTACRLIIDPAAEGPWNMAIDEALLDEAAKTEIPTLRFYQWKHPTLSLGYFQNYADRSKHPASLEANVVRRLSGGGAILHDRELTYSLFLPSTHPLARDTQTLYQAMHQAILHVLHRSLTPEWKLAICNSSAGEKPRSEPFLCFERRSSGDVLLQSTNPTGTSTDYKIVGSAQRRRRGTVMQHGSLLLDQSPLAPELLGLNDLLGTKLTAENILESLPSEISTFLNINTQPSSTADLHPAAEKLLKNRYACDNWSRHR